MDQEQPHHAEQGLTPALRRDLSEIADMATDEHTARIILALGCEPGDELAAQLVSAHGAVHLIRQISDGAVQDETPRLARWRQDVAGRLDVAEVSRVLLRSQERGLSTLIAGDPGWPALAGNPATHPLVLWTRGDASHLTSRAPRVAVIGARIPTDYGQDVARGLAIGLADLGVTILGSGWPGVDATAVLRAAVAGGPAIAVLPAGLDGPYPNSNANLFQATVSNGGVLVSACPPGRDTNRVRTQARGRLLAALADAVVITEGAYRCHAIKIAQEAVRLGVPVGAVPGPITSVTSTGTNDLLQRRVARVITHVTDAMNLITAPRPATPASASRSSGHAPVAPRAGHDGPATPAFMPL